MSMTLGDYRKMVVILWGEESPAVQYLDDKAKAEKEGADAEVIADESQVIHLLSEINVRGYISLPEGTVLDPRA